MAVTEDNDKRIKLIVRDTGIGIAANKLPLYSIAFSRQMIHERVNTKERNRTGACKRISGIDEGYRHRRKSAKYRQSSITVVFPVEKAGDNKAPEWKKELVKEEDRTSEGDQPASGNRKEMAGSNLPLLLLRRRQMIAVSFSARRRCTGFG